MRSIRFLFCCIISCWVLPAQCQTNYYPQDSGTLYLESGSVFEYRNEDGYIELYNAEAIHINEEWGMADGSTLPSDMFLDDTPSIKTGNMTPREVRRLIASFFFFSAKNNVGSARINYGEYLRQYPK